MNGVELIVFVAFLGFICWLAWRLYIIERDRVLKMIEREEVQTKFYRLFITQLEDMEVVKPF